MPCGWRKWKGSSDASVDVTDACKGDVGTGCHGCVQHDEFPFEARLALRGQVPKQPNRLDKPGRPKPAEV